MSDYVLADPFTVRRLRRGGADPLFAIDFPTFSARRRLSELLAERTGDLRPLYQVDPLTPLLDEPAYIALDEFAAEYAPRIADLCGPGDRPTVIGYCSAGALALRVAALLTRFTPDVRVLLVRPAWQDRAALRATFRDYVLELGGANPPAAEQTLSAAELVGWMGTRLEQELGRLAAGHGLSPANEAFTELLSRYRGWLAFVLACADAGPSRLPEGVDVLSLEGTSISPLIPLDPPREYRTSRHPLLDEAEILLPELADLVLGRLTIAENGVSPDAP